jgi:hypothetical protein
VGYGPLKNKPGSDSLRTGKISGNISFLIEFRIFYKTDHPYCAARAVHPPAEPGIHGDIHGKITPDPTGIKPLVIFYSII